MKPCLKSGVGGGWSPVAESTFCMCRPWVLGQFIFGIGASSGFPWLCSGVSPGSALGSHALSLCLLSSLSSLTPRASRSHSDSGGIKKNWGGGLDGSRHLSGMGPTRVLSSAFLSTEPGVTSENSQLWPSPPHHPKKVFLRK